MTEMIERVARAIYGHAASQPAGQPAWDDADEDVRNWLRGHAAEAIAAMRVPTDAMFKAGVGSADDAWYDLRLEISWRAMIDAALNNEVTQVTHAAQVEQQPREDL